MFREWAETYKFLCGDRLGGDYIHMLVEHSGMLFRRHGSMGKFKNEGFEGSHKVQRLMYALCSSHDCTAEHPAIKQILQHLYSQFMLTVRYNCKEAIKVQFEKTGKWWFRGCGWKNKDMPIRTDEDQKWLESLDRTFEEIYGSDVLEFVKIRRLNPDAKSLQIAIQGFEEYFM